VADHVTDFFTQYAEMKGQGGMWAKNEMLQPLERDARVITSDETQTAWLIRQLSLIVSAASVGSPAITINETAGRSHRQ
jgi:hypothetical protein